MLVLDESESITNVTAELDAVQHEMIKSYENLKITKIKSLQRSVNTSETA